MGHITLRLSHTLPSPQDVLHAQHSVECPVKCIQGVLYLRISAHIYNTVEDYHKVAAAVDDMLKHAEALNAVKADEAVIACRRGGGGCG